MVKVDVPWEPETTSGRQRARKTHSTAVAIDLQRNMSFAAVAIDLQRNML
jgi:hypothetical protein